MVLRVKLERLKAYSPLTWLGLKNKRVIFENKEVQEQPPVRSNRFTVTPSFYGIYINIVCVVDARDKQIIS